MALQVWSESPNLWMMKMLHSKRGQACRSSGLSTPVPSHDVCDLVLYIVAETSPGVLSTPLEEQNDKATAHRAGLDYSSRPLHSHVPADSIKKLVVLLVSGITSTVLSLSHFPPPPLRTTTSPSPFLSFPPDLPLRTAHRLPRPSSLD